VLAGSGEPGAPGTLVPIDYTGSTRSLRYHAFCESLAGHLETTRYDVIHAMLPVPPGLCDLYHPHAGVAARRRGPRVTWWVNPRRRMMARLERALLAGTDRPLTLTLSAVVERELRACYPDLPADATARLFNGVDLARFGPTGPAADRSGLGLAGEDVVALFVGNNFKLKGLAEAIGALERAADPRLKLAVVGVDDARPYRHQAERLGVADRVRWLGGRGDLPELYRAADVLVLPTYRDSCSLVVLEALACGLPVISTRQNGATEVMTDGEHGTILADPGDPRLAAALSEMLDERRRARMGAACVALRPALSWEHHLETLLGLYGRVVRQKRGLG
jgi:UDP-glucose:(heptosyl)LPS alpha-1,3-glucosyltransferase